MNPVPDMDESPQDDEVVTPQRRAPETPLNAAPMREPQLDPNESVLKPLDFIDFLLATDALLDPADPRAMAASSEYVKQLLAPPLRQDPEALLKFSRELPFPNKWSFWLDVTRPHGMSTKAFKRGLHVLGHFHSLAVRPRFPRSV